LSYICPEFANYVEETGLDGVDFDWEYPSEPDIDGVPAGSDDEANNYLEFLKQVKDALPSGTLLPVTLPSSYWYLKPFPVSNISNVVDYSNYMVSLSFETWSSSTTGHEQHTDIPYRHMTCMVPGTRVTITHNGAVKTEIVSSPMST
jgi:GH18 family chitinase